MGDAGFATRLPVIGYEDWYQDAARAAIDRFSELTGIGRIMSQRSGLNGSRLDSRLISVVFSEPRSPDLHLLGIR